MRSPGVNAMMVKEVRMVHTVAAAAKVELKSFDYRHYH